MLKFLHISDVHNSADAINECKSMMDNDSDIAFTILTGDYSSGSGSGSSSYSSVNSPLTNLGSKLLMVNGNHDVEDAFAKSQQNATTFLKGKVTNNEVVWGDSQGVASYWFRDFELSENSKLRIIGVDAYEFNTAYGSRYDTVYTQTQINWIVARMMELRSTDYLIFAMHEPPVDSTVVDYAYNQQGRMEEDIVAKRRANKFCSSRLWVWDSSLSNGNLLPMIVKAYKNRSIMATSLMQLNSLTRENILPLSLGYDFSNVQPATFLCYIGGHLHGEYAEYHPSSLYNDQLMLFVDNSNPSTLGSSSDIGTRSSDTASGTRSNGKLINEIALDFEHRTITITRYGQQNALSYNGFAAVTRDTISFPFEKLAVNPVSK